jgi:hypothetical protein
MSLGALISHLVDGLFERSERMKPLAQRLHFREVG